jgi:hypothetical protein
MQKNGDVMRADRLKQVMQEIDATFDEKDLGMSKFSRFCMEAAQKGLIHVAKLENGQLEVGLPRKNGEVVVAAAAPAPRAEGEREEGERRRGRRGRGRGRGGRDREERPATPVTGEMAIATPADVAAPAPQAAAPRPERQDRPERQPRPDRVPRPDRTPAAPPTDDTIGVAGIRLTRDEAFGLVRDAVAAVANEDNPVPSETVRAKAFALLGRDSESLSARNFARILKDAHDAGLLDLRKRGEAFEVTAVSGAPSIADQLAVAEAAHKPVVAPSAPAPRGMGVRGAPGRGGRVTAKPTLPAGLLLLGMVEEPTPVAVAEPVKEVVAEVAEKPAKKPAAKKAAAKKPVAKKAAAKKKAAK